ncbi:MAG: GntR family transcriptional regulator [Balneola sp.]
MDFSENKPIYKQIVEHFYNQILNQKWAEEERVPSVREVAVLMEVNPNTAHRAFQELQDTEILFNKRGVGYFVCEGAVSKVQIIKRKEFIDVKLPAVFKDMNLLGISFLELKKIYESRIKV